MENDNRVGVQDANSLSARAKKIAKGKDVVEKLSLKSKKEFEYSES